MVQPPRLNLGEKAVRSGLYKHLRVWTILFVEKIQLWNTLVDSYLVAFQPSFHNKHIVSQPLGHEEGEEEAVKGHCQTQLQPSLNQPLNHLQARLLMGCHLVFCPATEILVALPYGPLDDFHIVWKSWSTLPSHLTVVVLKVDFSHSFDYKY